jgi:putative oxidoreductase
MAVSRPQALEAGRWLVRLGLAAVFLYAGGLKLLDPNSLAEAIGNYRMLPPALVGPLALGLPVLEIVAGVALLIPPYTRGAAVLCALMLGAFAVAMAQSKLRGIDLDCGCFGASDEARVSWTKVTVDLLLAMLAVWIARPQSRALHGHAS